MDPSFPYDHQLAQMAIEQRKHEFRRFLEQSLVGPDGLFQMTSSNNSTQHYYPGPVVENGLAFRSNPMPEAQMEGHQTGSINPWGTMPEPFDYSTSSLTHTLVPDDALLASLFPVPHNTNTNVPSLIALTTRTRQFSSDAPGRSAHNDLTSWESPSATSSFSSQHNFRRSPAHLRPSQRPRHPARESPTIPQSPVISISSKQSSLPSCASMSPAPTASGADYASPGLSVGESDQEQNGGQPYSRLIWEALMATEEKMLPLQGIYQWFEQNTDKGKNEELKGWQNSIRHNLSMNAVRVLPTLIRFRIDSNALQKSCGGYFGPWSANNLISCRASNLLRSMCQARRPLTTGASQKPRFGMASSRQPGIAK